MTVICRHITTAAVAATTAANTITIPIIITSITIKINSETPTDVSIFCFQLPSFLVLKDFWHSTQSRITEDFNVILILVMAVLELEGKAIHNPFMLIN